jgi:hypothetical protein
MEPALTPDQRIAEMGPALPPPPAPAGAYLERLLPTGPFIHVDANPSVIGRAFPVGLAKALVVTVDPAAEPPYYLPSAL